MADDAKYIRRAIDLARQARERGNHPFGALLVADERIVLEAENTVVSQNNPTHHAELNLVQAAWQTLPSELIRRSTLYTHRGWGIASMARAAARWARFS